MESMAQLLTAIGSSAWGNAPNALSAGQAGPVAPLTTSQSIGSGIGSFTRGAAGLPVTPEVRQTSPIASSIGRYFGTNVGQPIVQAEINRLVNPPYRPPLSVSMPSAPFPEPIARRAAFGIYPAGMGSSTGSTAGGGVDELELLRLLLALQQR